MFEEGCRRRIGARSREVRKRRIGGGRDESGMDQRRTGCEVAEVEGDDIKMC